jgi:hypothetical protein
MMEFTFLLSRNFLSWIKLVTQGSYGDSVILNEMKLNIKKINTKKEQKKKTKTWEIELVPSQFSTCWIHLAEPCNFGSYHILSSHQNSPTTNGTEI